MSRTSAFIWNSATRPHRLFSLLLDDFSLSRRLSLLPEQHEPSLRVFEKPYPDLADLDSSIFEPSLLHNIRERTESKSSYHVLILEAVRSSDFNRAEVLRKELGQAGIIVGPDDTFRPALEYAVSQAEPSKRLVAFLNWIPLIPPPTRNPESGRLQSTAQIRKTLRWALAQVYDAASLNTEGLVTAGVRLMQLGHVELVCRHVLSAIIRTTEPERSLEIHERMKSALLDRFIAEGIDQVTKKDSLITLYSSSIFAYTLAGYFDASIQVASRAFKDDVLPNEFSLNRLEEELKNGDSIELLESFVSMRIGYLLDANDLKQALRRYSDAYIKSISISRQVLIRLHAELRDLDVPSPMKYLADLADVKEKAAREKRRSLQSSRCKNLQMKGASEEVQVGPPPLEKHNHDLNLPEITEATLQMAAQYIQKQMTQTSHRLSASYVAHFILTCENVMDETLLPAIRKEIFQTIFRPVQTLWLTAEMIAYRRRKDWYGILELHANHFVLDYGVSQRLLDVFLKRFASLKVTRSRASDDLGDTLRLTQFKLLPSSHNLSLLWEALVRLSYRWKWLTIENLFQEFLKTVRISHGLEKNTANPSTRTLHRLAPVARFDATHFTHFLRAYGSRWCPEKALTVLFEMKALGISPNARTWTLLSRLYARGKRGDASRANQILDRAFDGMQGTPRERTRVGARQGPTFASLQMYAVLMKAHIGRRHRREAWHVYHRLLEAGYKVGSDQVLDSLILQLFKLGRVRSNRKRPLQPRSKNGKLKTVTNNPN